MKIMLILELVKQYLKFQNNGIKQNRSYLKTDGIKSIKKPT